MLRLAHFTDIHVTASPREIPWRELLSKRFLGWVNLTVLGRAGAFAEAPQVTRAFVEDVMRVAPDRILATGDFTAISLPCEFTAAREALQPLFEGEADVTAIPGNHDVYVRSALRRRLYEEAFAPWVRTDLEPESFPAELRHLWPYPLVRLFGDEAALVCLRDARPALPHDSSGRAGAEQLRLLASLLADRRVASRTPVLALHYGLRRADGSPDTCFHRLRDAERVLQVAGARGVRLVVHGHLHRRFVLPAGAAGPAAVANPGSLTSRHGDRAYHIYTIDGPRIRLEARRYDPARGEFVPWPDAPGAGALA
jgi:3',5'-cyclic AMP phosphodiesterase CpdA